MANELIKHILENRDDYEPEMAAAFDATAEFIDAYQLKLCDDGKHVLLPNVVNMLIGITSAIHKTVERIEEMGDIKPVEQREVFIDDLIKMLAGIVLHGMAGLDRMDHMEDMIDTLVAMTEKPEDKELN